MFGINDTKQISGVTCTVANCNYHGTSNCCTAGQIKVGTEYAQDRAETFCSTFEQRQGM